MNIKTTLSIIAIVNLAVAPVSANSYMPKGPAPAAQSVQLNGNDGCIVPMGEFLLRRCRVNPFLFMCQILCP